MFCAFRVESFIEHQDACNVRRVRPEVLQALQPVCSSRSASSTSPSSDNNFGIVPLQRISVPPNTSEAMFLGPERYSCSSTDDHHHNLELQLLPSSNHVLRSCDQNHATNLKLSIGSPIQGKDIYYQKNMQTSIAFVLLADRRFLLLN